MANLHLYLAAAVRDNGAGRAIATELSAAKARACADRSSQRGTEAARDLGATFIHIDPTDDCSVEAAAARVRSEYGHMDVLINNAGTAAPRLGAEELTTDTEALVTVSPRSNRRTAVITSARVVTGDGVRAPICAIQSGTPWPMPGRTRPGARPHKVESSIAVIAGLRATAGRMPSPSVSRSVTASAAAASDMPVV